MEGLLLKEKEQNGLRLIKRSDLGPLLVDQLALTPNEISPFSEVLGNYVPGNGSISPGGEALATADFREAVAPVMAAPGLLIKNRLGGSMIDLLGELTAAAVNSYLPAEQAVDYTSLGGITVDSGDGASLKPEVEELSFALPGQATETPAAEENWHMERQGQRFGPYSRVALFDYARQGKILPDDYLWSKTTKGWIRSDTMPGLFRQS